MSKTVKTKEEKTNKREGGDVFGSLCSEGSAKCPSVFLVSKVLQTGWRHS
jgi:hypothetical protein